MFSNCDNLGESWAWSAVIHDIGSMKTYDIEMKKMRLCEGLLPASGGKGVPK